MKGYKKIFAATFLMAVLMVPFVLSGNIVSMVSAVRAPNGSGEYAYMNGVLDSEKNLIDPDTGWAEGVGTLYPFENDASLNIGFSKYGEMINPEIPLGLSYGGRDAFCRPPDIDPSRWLNGWVIEISYVSTVASPANRFVWAFALFADGMLAGGPWARVLGDGGALGYDEQAQPSLGGRQTNTMCDTEPIRWLQNDPRRAVAVLVTHIYDLNAYGYTVIGNPWPLVDLYITLIFNKVKKYVIIIKDVCYKLPVKELDIDVKLSNREEVDVGPYPVFDSYAHFWHQKFSTCYGGNWLKARWILREALEDLEVGLGTGAPAKAPTGNPITFQCYTDSGKPAVRGSEKILLSPPGYYYVTPKPGETPPPMDYTDWTLQIASQDYDYQAFGSPTDEYEGKGVMGITWKKTVPLGTYIHMEYKNFMKTLKVKTANPDPFTNEMGYVDTALSHEYDLAQFISTDGVDIGGGVVYGTVKDRKVVFKAYWPTLSSYTLDGWLQKFKTIHYPSVSPTTWCAEQDMAKEPAVPFSIGQWDFMLDRSVDTQFRGVEVMGMVNWHDADDVNANDLNADTAVENQVDTEVYWQLQEVFNPWSFNDALNLKNMRRLVEYIPTPALKTKYTLQQLAAHKPEWRDPADATFDGNPTMGGDTSTTFDVCPEDKYNATLEYWYRYCTFAEKIIVDGVLLKPGRDYELGAWTSTSHPTATKDLYFLKLPSTSPKVAKILYSTLGGVAPFSDTSVDVTWAANYEWIVLGRGSAPVDSVGSGMVTEMFKNKQMPVLWSGLDMQDTTYGPRVPFVLVKLGGGASGYEYNDPDPLNVPGRLTLKDDWCTSVPIKSSNMIGIGGPLANKFTKYWNDFTNAYWETANGAKQIRALTCWSKNKYYSPLTDNIGYGVISTYKDLDGTVGFLVWGITGEDTYWTCWWLWHFGYKLQFEPKCVTDIVLKFDYSLLDTGFPPTSHDKAKYKPGACFWEVVETLGTISEFDNTDTRLMAVWTGTGLPTTVSLLEPPTTGSLELTLFGCTTPGAPSVKFTHWSSSPFFMMQKGTVGTTFWVKVNGATDTTATIDWDKGTLKVTGTSISTIALKSKVKQPPLHLCSTYGNLPVIVD